MSPKMSFENTDSTDWLANSYCGYRMTQMWRDFFLWEEILNENPDTNALVEFGTAHGGFSLYLLHQAQARGWDFYTFDIVDPINDDRLSVFGADTIGNCADLGPYFHRADVLGDHGAVMTLIGHYEKVILFCDNGSKAREVEQYRHFLPKGSIIVAHDWNREIHPSDISPELTEVYGEYCDKIDSWTRFFKV